VRRPKPKPTRAPVPRAPNEIGYYPGCSLHGLAKDFDYSARTVLEILDIQPVTPKGWICCGSSPAHRVDHRRSIQMPLESLVLYEQEGLKEVTLPCAMCFNRFRASAHELRLDPELKQDLEREIGYEYQDSVAISSLLDFVVDHVGLEAIAEKVQKPLEGLKVVCYYGCLLTRPPEITGSEEPEYPMAMDRLMKTLGATVLDWDRKVSCCGASLSLTKTELVYEMTGNILQNALDRGADAVVLACPMCHINLDGRQTQMDIEHIPVLYFTQLMALALGRPDDAALEYNMIDPRPLLQERGLL
jgi:heterodisulfide reductase subunit B